MTKPLQSLAAFVLMLAPAAYAADTPVITTTANLYGTVGQTFLTILGATGGKPSGNYPPKITYTWKIAKGTLPAGLTLDAVTGKIAGTPTANGTFPITITVEDAFGDVSAPVDLSVNIFSGLKIVPDPILDNASSANHLIVGVQYLTLLEATGGTFPYVWSATGLPPGLKVETRSDNKVNIVGTPTAAGTYKVTLKVTDCGIPPLTDTASFTLTVDTPDLRITTAQVANGVLEQPYSQHFDAAGGSGHYTWKVVSGTLPPQLTLSSGGDLSGVAHAIGDFTFTVQVDDSHETATRTFTLHVASTLHITTTTLIAGFQGVPYSQTLTAEGGVKPYKWAIVKGDLPANFNPLGADDGKLTGTPNASGQFTFTAQVTDALGSTDQASLTLQLNEPAPTLLIDVGPQLAPGQVSFPYSSGLIQVFHAKEPFTFRVVPTTPLPPGLSLDGSNGTYFIRGTPLQSGTFYFGLQCIDADNNNDVKFTRITIVPDYSFLRIKAPPNPLTAVVGQDFSYQLQGSGGEPATYFWSLYFGGTLKMLPAGLALDQVTGKISGRPTVWGPGSDVGIQLTDKSGTTFAANATIHIDVSPSLSTSQNNDAPVGDPVSAATGELYDAETDLSLGAGLLFRRYYSSSFRAAGLAASLGANWLHNFDIRLNISGDTAQLQFERGRPIGFTRDASGTWTVLHPEKLGYQLVTKDDGTTVFLDPDTNRTYTFSKSGDLVQESDRNGNTLTIAQGAHGPDVIVDGRGRSLTFAYNSAGQLASVRDQAGRIVQFDYTGANLTKVTDAGGHVQTYSYTSAGAIAGLMTARTRPNGNVPFTQTFDNAGRVVKQADSQGNTTTIVYNPSTPGNSVALNPVGVPTSFVHQNYANLTRLTDSDQQSAAISYDGDARRTSVTNKFGDATLLTWHSPSGYLASVTDALGQSTKWTYIAQSQGPFTYYVASQIRYPDGATVSLAYDGSGNILSRTDETGKVTRYTYDSHGQLLTYVNPAGGVTTFTYNSDGTLATRLDVAGNLSAYTYDLYKRLARIQQPDNTTRAFEYDANDRLLRAVDENGSAVALTYDANGNPVAVTDPLGKSSTAVFDSNDRAVTATDRTGQAESLSYNEVGKVKARTNAAGESESFIYDNQDRLARVLDPAGKATQFVYDAEGVLAATTDPLQRSMRFMADKLGRMAGIVLPSGAAYSRQYDSRGRLISITNPLQQSRSLRYDTAGRLMGISLPLGIGATFSRDDLGNLVKVTDANGSSRSYAYDAAGRMLSRTDALSRVQSFDYDKRNRVSQVTTPAGNATFTYDATGNLVRSLYSDGTDLQFGFDAAGRITTGSWLDLAYDDEDRIVSSNGLAITRDAVGRISSITFAPGKTVNYTYDRRGLLVSVTDWVGGSTTITYDDAGQMVSMTRPNGIAARYTYDLDGGLASIDEGCASPLFSIALHRDGEGKVIAADRNLPAQLEVAPGGLSLAFDAANQVAGFDYDGMGRLVRDTFRNYTWDGGSRLSGYSGSDGAASATYDAFGMRVATSSAAGARSYVWNYALDLPSVATVRDDAGDLRYYIHTPAGKLLYAIEAGGARHFYHFDETGSAVALTDDSGSITDSYAIAPYGETVTQTGTTENPFTWMGAWGVMQEGSTGLYYMRARYYDSTTARFLSPDPVSSLDPKKINPYQYAGANPLGRVDAMGADDDPIDLDALQKMLDNLVANGVMSRREADRIYARATKLHNYTKPDNGGRPSSIDVTPIPNWPVTPQPKTYFRIGYVESFPEPVPVRDPRSMTDKFYKKIVEEHNKLVEGPHEPLGDPLPGAKNPR
jgi:RHS repeat-associated protein